MMLDSEQCRQARLARDARFDGQFYVAVKTTGIYCRPICPATAPKEQNVEYYPSAIAAAKQGFRPCLRCRPDSAPGSCAWKGVDTTVERALSLIDEGYLSLHSVTELAARLGISDRYLRLLFREKLGTTAKHYALYQQLLFAKQLLHQSALSVTDVAFASGFNSIRQFNSAFKQHFQLTPQQIRKQSLPTPECITLFLSYRPPYCWSKMQGFLAKRLIPAIECLTDNSYGRSFGGEGLGGEGLGGEGMSGAGGGQGYFIAEHQGDKNGFAVQLYCQPQQNILPIIKNIRRILDLDTDILLIEQQLAKLALFSGPDSPQLTSGLRLPGLWHPFEAGLRAILGQQISVEAARRLVCQVVEHYGPPLAESGPSPMPSRLFPRPVDLNTVDFSLLKMPQSRRNTLMGFVQFWLSHGNVDDLTQWATIKGIGPWTINYAKMRGQSDSDIWLGSDLGVKKALGQLSEGDHDRFDAAQAKPWRSYLTFHCWNLL